MTAVKKRRWLGRFLICLVAILLLNFVFNRIFYFDPPDPARRWELPRAINATGQLESYPTDNGRLNDRPLVVTNNRLDAHKAAVDELAAFTFYREGEGMFATPRVSDMYFQWGIERGWKGAAIRQWARGSLGLYSATNEATGFLERRHNGVRVVVTGCAVCHFGRAAGRDIPGLGYKNIDPFALGRWIENGDGWLRLLSIGSESETAVRLRETSLRMARRLQVPGISNQTEGLVPVALVIAWFYRQADRELPAEMTPGAVKVPALWGYGAKTEGGVFCDGMGDSHQSAWAGMVELAAGNSVTNIRSQFDRIQQVESTLGDLLPPAYPFAIDAHRASIGAGIFKEYCRRCHGQYGRDAEGWPEFLPPRAVEELLVGTDPDRLDIVTEEARGMVAESVLADLIRLNGAYQRGYLAPRLDGIWARFPYLHNASVPNLESLLTPPSERPMHFDLHNAGELERFDQKAVGLNVPPNGSPVALGLSQQVRAGSRQVYDCGKLGQSNRGHEFGINLSPESKLALLEYLKTL